MILIIGNNHDDILYFETRLTNKVTDRIFNKYSVISGTLANQKVVLIDGVYTNILSSAIVSYIIQKYYILFVLKIGKVNTLSNKFKAGDVLVGRRVIATDVNVTDIQGTKLGQIPGLNTSFSCSADLVNMILNSFIKCTFLQANQCNVLSSSYRYTSKDQLSNLVYEDRIFNEPINEVVFDSEAYGVAVACALHDIPFATINVVLSKVGESFKTENYVKVLKQYSVVGKALCNTISELGSNEVLR